MAWHQTQTSIVTLMQLPHELLCTLQCPKLKIHNRIGTNVSFLILSLKFPTTSNVIHHYLVNLWEFCVYFLSASCRICDRITIWVLKQTAERCESICSILSFGVLSKICFISVNHAYWNWEKNSSNLSVNMISTNGAYSATVPNNKILHPESHLSAISFWHSNCYPSTGHDYSVMSLTKYWIHTTFPQLHNAMNEVLWNFTRIIVNGTFLQFSSVQFNSLFGFRRSQYTKKDEHVNVEIRLYFFNFGHYKLHFETICIVLFFVLRVDTSIHLI